MINSHVRYLRRLGTERIKDYINLLLSRYNFGIIEKAYIRQLPEYYNQDCPRMEKFVDIMTELNFWYTLYL